MPRLDFVSLNAASSTESAKKAEMLSRSLPMAHGITLASP